MKLCHQHHDLITQPVTFFWHWANQSLSSPNSVEHLARKQQVSILKYLVWLDQGSNVCDVRIPRSPKTGDERFTYSAIPSDPLSEAGQLLMEHLWKCLYDGTSHLLPPPYTHAASNKPHRSNKAIVLQQQFLKCIPQPNRVSFNLQWRPFCNVSQTLRQVTPQMLIKLASNPRDEWMSTRESVKCKVSMPFNAYIYAHICMRVCGLAFRHAATQLHSYNLWLQIFVFIKI